MRPAAFVLSMLLLGCASARSPQAPVRAAAPAQTAAPADTVAAGKAGPGALSLPNADPFPSTYTPFPSHATLITGATIFTAAGPRLPGGALLMNGGRIVAIAASANAPEITNAAAQLHPVVIDATGKFITPGIVDVHSHRGVYPAPETAANSDGNEATNPATPNVWAEHSVWPQDPQFPRDLAGGVTTEQILPGSANLFGGRSVVLKVVPARTVQGMKFPGARYGLKMACGENPKRVYGSKGGPSTRMGNVAGYRAQWIKAEEYRRKWDKWNADHKGDPPARDLGLETLAEVLRGNILVQNHCYRADEMANMIDLSKEMGYHISAFHHAVEAYKIADLLRENDVCAVMWADWYGFKMESYDAIKENIPFVHNAGACAIVHSDDPNYIQRLNQEAAKALADGVRAGIPNLSEGVAWEWLSRNPAKALGILEKTGTLTPGKMADVVMWNGDPFSDYSRPERVWIDGALMYDANDPKRRPVSDFELGQPGQGDTK